jgi:hypothetical protein
MHNTVFRGKVAFLLVVVILATVFLFIHTVPSGGDFCEREAAERVVLLELIPQNTEGRKLQSDPKLEFYGRATLWDYINGQAAMYLDYGFQHLATAEYKSLDGSRSTVIEIYQMKTSEHAFGIYAAERSPSDNFIEMGVQGYLGDYYLNFWKGPYYVKLIAFQPFADTKRNLMKLASAVAESIEGLQSEPELFNSFPERDKVPMSERFIPTNFLGQAYLKNGYRVDYEAEGKRFQAFLVRNGSPEEAQDAYAKYQDFLQSDNEQISSTSKNDYHVTFIKGERSTIIFQYGSFIGGVVGCEDLPHAERTIEEMLPSLIGK